ncbi:unnamed protein product, partial [Polarella glacialis]
MLASEIIFPASPNWYISHVADALPDGTLAIATNQAVTVVDAATRHVRGICSLRGRVTGVALGRGILCACSSDRGVHAFDLATLQQTGSHKDHHAEPCAVVLAPQLCITGDKRGTICLWPSPGVGPAKGMERLVPQREGVVCLAVSGETPDGIRLAAGYSSGTVVVICLEARSVLCNFRHRSPLHSLSWVPGSSGRCLASACQDQSVQLWKLSAERSGEAGQDPETAESELISEAAGHGPSREDASRLWTCVCAFPDGLILFSGPRGELFSWESSRQKPQRAALVHTRPIFGIRCVGSEHALTAGMDRFVVLWSVSKGAPPQMKWRLCSLGGHVTALRTDSANLACIGCGDNSIRFVDLMHREHRQHCWVVWKGLRTAATSLACLPGRGVWAYGLQDGSFGAIAANSADGPGPVETLCSRNHPGAVTSVCWLKLSPQVNGDTAPTADTPVLESDVVEGAEASTASKKGAGKGKKVDERRKGLVEVDCRPLLQGFALVSVSAGHIMVTPIASGKVSSVSSPLGLLPLSGASPQPSVAASWSLPDQDVLVAAATHKAREDSLEINSIQLFEPEPSGVAGVLRCVAALPAEGLEGGVTTMSLWPSIGPAGTCCRVLCGTGKGSLAVFCIPWPPPDV